MLACSSDPIIHGRPLGLASVHTSALVGLDPHPIRVEVCCTRGPSRFQMVGLAEAAVREARVRVASALARLDVLLDEYAITVNLAPADLRKSGASLDVAIAVGVLGAIDRLPPPASSVLLLGELALDGTLRPVRGVLPQLQGARARGVATAIVPEGSAAEAGLVRGLDVRVATALGEIVESLCGRATLRAAPRTPLQPERVPIGCPDLADVRGQMLARRSLEIAASGGHNLLLIGPPGSGKTLLARALPGVLPPLDVEEMIETTAIHSVAGLVDPARGVVGGRPFRAPHHSVSEAGLIGGGEVPRPGEVSLAHHGVLFLDELAEFRRATLESLRQPLEDGRVCIARARARAWFPARPLVVGAVNPCPCGWYRHPSRPCRCTEERRRAYLARLSGPLLDRLDVHVTVPPVEVSALIDARGGEPSAVVRDRVNAARAVQHARFEAGETTARCNAALSQRDLERVAALDAQGRAMISRAVTQLGLSARAYAKVLRVARTIADMEREPCVRKPHVEEAISGRLLDRERLV